VLLKTTILLRLLTTPQLSARLRLIPNHLLASSQLRSVGISLRRHPQLNNSLPSLKLSLLHRPQRLSSLKLHHNLSLSNPIWSPQLVRWKWMRIMMIAATKRRDRSRPRVRETALSLATVQVTIEEVLCKKRSSVATVKTLDSQNLNFYVKSIPPDSYVQIYALMNLCVCLFCILVLLTTRRMSMLVPLRFQILIAEFKLNEPN
jgi:hypothetical protein